MTEKPFIHKKAFADVKTNFIYHEKIIPILFKVLKKKGILNIGGKTQTIFNFAKKENDKIKKIFLSNDNKIGIPRNASMNLNKLKSLIK